MSQNPLVLKASRPSDSPRGLPLLALLLRRKRRDLGAGLTSAAAFLSVSARTLTHWESGKLPFVSSYPKIITLLGRDPWPEPQTLHERLIAARYRRGLRRDQAAPLLGVDASTLWRWEGGGRVHLLEHRRRIDAFIGGAQRRSAEELSEPPSADLEGSLGRRIRTLRHARGLSQERAATELGVSPWTWMNWETDKHVPEVRYFASMIRILGGEPWPPAATLAEKLLAERRRRGLTQAEAAAVMHVDQGSIWLWESGRRTPRFRDAKAKIEAFLAGRPRPTRAGLAKKQTGRAS